MKENTYHRMTRRSPLRGLKLFKHKYLTKQRFYALLASLKLLREVKNDLSFPYDENDLIGKITMLDENITTERGTFNLSYRAEALQNIYQWYYESLRGKKILFTVRDEIRYHLCVEVRSECTSFLVKIDPFKSCWVQRERPCLHLYSAEGCYNDTSTSTVTRHKCDFFNARLKANVHLGVESCEDIEEAIKELLQRARHEITSFIENHPEEINERLTGVKHDGEFHTKEGMELLKNNICSKCGRPVFESPLEEYTAQCLFCDEDLYSIEVLKVDPKKYEDIYEFNKRGLQKILS